jgi:hypothetical protein
MARGFTVLTERDLERALLRNAVGALAEGRHACSDCGRTPLDGERVFRFRRARWVCALCARERSAEPEAVEMVRHSEGGTTVRRLLPRAA